MAEGVVRKLAAILSADAVGFTRRVAEHEAAALRAVKASLEIAEQVIGLHGGRVVKTMGDGLLAEFGSVVNAVSAAATIQSRLSARKRDVPDNAHFDFRIGVHVGDVVVDGDDILGDGVNTAARLQEAAPSAGVLVSQRVHDDVAGKLELTFENAGEKRLPGIARAVHTFVLAPSRPTIAAALMAMPDKPSVAVLPFLNLSSDPEQDYFADGLTEDIITGLAAVPWLFVIARNSSFIYKGAAIDVRDVGRHLGVRYVLEGSVRRAGARLRVTGQLADAETGAQLWADRIDGMLEDVFDLQDTVTEAVVAAIAPQVRAAEQARAARKRPESLSAYDRLLRAMAAINRAQIAEANIHLDATIAEAPDYAKALALRAWVHTLQVGWQAEGNFATHSDKALALSRQALELAPADVEVSAHAAYAMGFFGAELDRCLSLLQGAVQRCPSLVWAWASLGMHQGHHHDPVEGLAACDEAIRLSPRDPMAFRAHLAKAAALFYARRWSEVPAAARRSLEINPANFAQWVFLVTALGDGPDTGTLTRARTELMTRFPEASITRFRQCFGHFRNFVRQRDELEARMHDAGLPR
jgi:adenylate cyclase